MYVYLTTNHCPAMASIFARAWPIDPLPNFWYENLGLSCNYIIDKMVEQNGRACSALFPHALLIRCAL